MHKTNKTKLIILPVFMASLTLTSFFAVAADKYVTDNISVYLRRGPGIKYAFIGTLKSGDKVTVLQTSEDGSFTQVRDEKNRVAWINSDILTDTPSLKGQYPELKQRLSTLQEQVNEFDKEKQLLIDDYTNQLNTSNQQITTLKNQNEQLQNQIDQQKNQLANLNDQINHSEQNIKEKWFTLGGIVAGAGLIIGLILPYIMPRRRRKDRWMN